MEVAMAGPIARSADDIVWLRPLTAPSDFWFGADEVMYISTHENDMLWTTVRDIWQARRTQIGHTTPNLRAIIWMIGKSPNIKTYAPDPIRMIVFGPSLETIGAKKNPWNTPFTTP